jgi:toxin ParE1/3/4
MSVRFTLEAHEHIVAIRSFIETKSRPAASRIIDRIFSECDRLGDFPQLGHIGTVPGTYEWIVPHLPYIIVHEITPKDDVIIIAVFHGAQKR